MNNIVYQNESTAALRRIFFRLVDATDDETPEGGKTFSGSDIVITKRGGAAANMLGTAAEVSGITGLYYYQMDASEVDTYGNGVAVVTKAGCNTEYVPFTVVAYNPYSSTNLGLTNLANAVLDADDTADAILDRADGVESGITVQEALQYIAAMLVGKITGAGSGTETFYAVGNASTPRVIHTVDSNKNRTATTLS